VILIEDGKLALIERNRHGQVYYLFPGGRIESGEWPTETAAREIAEELGLVVEVQRLVAQARFRGQTQYFFLAERRGGEFGSGAGEEMSSPADSKRGSFTPVWMPLEELAQHTIRPPSVVQLVLKAMCEGWPEKIQFFAEHRF
jgi:8-oxo-dGTP diphosphatase